MACGRLAFFIPMMSAKSLLTFMTLTKAAGAVLFLCPSLLFFDCFFLIILLLFFSIVFFEGFDILRLTMFKSKKKSVYDYSKRFDSKHFEDQLTTSCVYCYAMPFPM